MSKHWEQNKDATVYVGNIDERFSQELLSELMTQVGPVRQVHMPQDRVSQTHQGYGFVEFDTPASAEYAAKVLNGIRVWGKPIRVNKASADKQKTVDIGAELFINNLDSQVDEKILYDTFSQFGQILRQPNIIRDDNNISKGYGFVSFDSFEASDIARNTMNGQYLLSKAITIEYAYKKDGKGERHGDEAERKLAAEGKKHNIVPEQQQLPPGFHMTNPSAPPAGAAPIVDPSSLVSPVAGGVPPLISPVGMPPAGAGYGAMPPGTGGMGRGGPPPPAYGNMPAAGGRMPVSLPPAPSGLPARPPPSHAGFGGPVANFHPVPGGPPPAGLPAPPQMYPGMPPPGGFPGAPPTGFPGAPPAGFPGAPPAGFPGAPGAPLPPGFMPPPGGVPPQGFGGPPVPAPNGYGRR